MHDVTMTLSVAPAAGTGNNGHHRGSAAPQPSSSFLSSGRAWSGVRHSAAVATTKHPLWGQAGSHELPSSDVQWHRKITSDFPCTVTTVVQADNFRPTKTDTNPRSCGVANSSGNAGGVPALRDDGDGGIAASWAEAKRTGAKKLEAAAAAAASGTIDGGSRIVKRYINPTLGTEPVDSRWQGLER